jgi:hypothetical protein
MNRTFHRLIHINSVDAISGDIVSFDEKDAMHKFIIGLQGSTAVPFVFLPVPFEDKLLMDGGVVWNLDVASAILKCKEIVDDNSKIFIDIIDVDMNMAAMPEWSSSGNLISNYMRLKQIRNFYKRMDDEIQIETAFPDINYRYIIMPETQLDPIYKDLSVNQALVQKMINRGMNDALEAIRRNKNE